MCWMKKRNPVFPSACGELYLAGDCLAAGYIGREDLTAQAFLPDPFSPEKNVPQRGTWKPPAPTAIWIFWGAGTRR